MTTLVAWLFGFTQVSLLDADQVGLLDAQPKAGIFLFGFSFIWNVFIAFWTWGATLAGAPTLFPMFSIPFWGVGGALCAATLSSF